MRWPRPRWTIGQLSIGVAAVALVLGMAINAARPGAGITDRRIVIPLASAIAATYGLGAFRHPWATLAPLVVLYVLLPGVDHPTPNVTNMAVGGCGVAWLIAAPAGWASRATRRP